MESRGGHVSVHLLNLLESELRDSRARNSNHVTDFELTAVHKDISDLSLVLFIHFKIFMHVSALFYLLKIRKFQEYKNGLTVARILETTETFRSHRKQPTNH